MDYLEAIDGSSQASAILMMGSSEKHIQEQIYLLFSPSPSSRSIPSQSRGAETCSVTQRLTGSLKYWSLSGGEHSGEIAEALVN